jgi:hypothetical protein
MLQSEDIFWYARKPRRIITDKVSGCRMLATVAVFSYLLTGKVLINALTLEVKSARILNVGNLLIGS